MGDSVDPAVIVRPAGGGEIVRSAEDAKASAALGEHQVDPGVHAADARDTARRAMFDNFGDKALTFAEGTVDAAFAGLLHEHGDAADMRRDVNSGSAFLGQLTGTAIGIEHGGPLKFLGKAGTKGGRLAAQLALGTAEDGSRAALLTRGLESAGEGAAVMGGQAFGHQLSDTVIEDKPFSTEVVLHEATLGALLSGTAGILSGAFSRVASRGAVEAQGGLVAGEGVATHVQGAVDGLNDATAHHASRLGVLEQLADEGHLPDDFMGPRREAVKAAQAAGKKLEGLDLDQALQSDSKEYLPYRKALDEYQTSVSNLDELMRPKQYELATRLQLGRAEDLPPGGEMKDFEGIYGPGEIPYGTDELVTKMRADPAAREAYKQQWGRDFEESDAAKAYEEAAQHNFDQKQAAEAQAAPTEPMTAAGPPETYASPEEGTAVGKRKPGKPAPVDAEVPAEAQGPAEAPLQVAETGAPAEYSPETQALKKARPIAPTEDAMVRDNVLSHGNPEVPRTPALLPDGHFLPAAQVEEVAQSFSRFRDHMAEDTMVRKARKAATLGKQPVAETVQHVRPTPEGVQAGLHPELDKTNVDTVNPARINAALDKEAATANKLTDKAFDQAKTGVRPVREAPPAEPVDLSKTQVSGAPRGMPAERANHVKQYINDWAQEASKLGPRITPGDKAAAKISEAMNGLRDASQGRFTSASTLELGEKLGVSDAKTPLGEMLDQAWTVRQAGRLAADETRGVATPLRASSKSHVLDWMKRRAGGKLGAAVASGVLGGAVGGPVGYFMGAAMAAKYLGFGGKVAAASGRVYEATIKAADALLKGSRATIAARAVAGNRPYQYSERGPIKDPVARIEDLRRMAANPDLIRDQVLKSAGDIALVQPSIVGMMQEHAVAQVTALSMRAPAIYYNALGTPLQPGAGELRQFLEFENATHSYDGILNSISSNSVTRTQAEALQSQWPQIHGKLVQGLLADPKALQGMQMAKLKTIELITGYPLTPGSDPAYIARQQAAWLDPASSPGQGGKAQSFKITAPASLPTQSQTGRAPGN